jgi:hypothetical protein
VYADEYSIPENFHFLRLKSETAIFSFALVLGHVCPPEIVPPAAKAEKLLRFKLGL